MKNLQIHTQHCGAIIDGHEMNLPSHIISRGAFSPQVSNEKNPGCLGYIGDYTTQLYRDFSKPL